MPIKIKPSWSFIPIIVALCLSSCSPPSPAIKIKETETAISVQSILKTAIGDFLIASVDLVDEVNGQQARPGQKILLITLTQTDSKNLVPGEFSLEAFQRMIQDGSGSIHVCGADGSQSISTMAGWVQDEFAMGFAIPIAKSYTLYWAGNSPIELHLNGR